jgi:hypothetical protein
MATASIGLSEFESELLPESELEGEYASEFELESPEAFGWSDIKKAAGDVATWAGDTWRDIQTPGTNARRIAIDVDKAAITGGAALLGTGLGGPIGGTIGGIAGAGLSSALLPPSQYEGEGEFESEFELSPIRRVYPDAMLEHVAHEALEAESEQEAAEHMLKVVPMVAGKLVPLAARAAPRIAAKVIPRITRTVTRVTPQLTRGVSNITRTLFRNPQSRRLVRVVPSIARRTVTQIARHAAAGRPVSPRAAVQILRRQAHRVIANPQQTAMVLRRSNALDRGFHRVAGIPWRPWQASYTASGRSIACPRCNYQFVNRLPQTCRCCGQLITR